MRIPFVALMALVAGFGAGGYHVLSQPVVGRSIHSALTWRAASSCSIKGNLTGGERIYHMPGQAYYEQTTINTLIGERWFCSEAEARAAGWRRSRV
jgi:hypothetical protein